MSEGTLYLIIFLLAALAGLGGLFAFGWRRRKDKMPKVAPLPKDADDDWK
jgi:LPXTG-motif cell wall-anchored protein